MTDFHKTAVVNGKTYDIPECVGGPACGAFCASQSEGPPERILFDNFHPKYLYAYDLYDRMQVDSDHEYVWQYAGPVEREAE